jgi:hypothetical protein
MTTATTGTGTITLGAAAPGFLTFAQAGVADGDTVTYAIQDGANSEIGRGVYTSSGTTLSRTVLKSTNADSALSLSGTAQVFITAAAEDCVTDGDKGDVVVSSGSWTIDTGAVTFSKMQNVATNTILGRATAGSGVIEALTPAQVAAVLASAGLRVRKTLSANTTVYVRTDGNDANDGLTNSAGGAKATWQAAYDMVTTWDLNGYTVTIKSGNNGTWTAGAYCKVPVLGGAVAFEGDTTTPSNVVVTSSGSAFSSAGPGVNISVRGFRVSSSTWHTLLAERNARLWFGNLDFAASPGVSHIHAESGGLIENASHPWSISGGANVHLQTDAGTILVVNQTCTVSGTPAFTWFASSYNAGVINAYGMTFSGAATGTRYLADVNGVIRVWGVGANYFPGNAAGSASTGGQYI